MATNQYPGAAAEGANAPLISNANIQPSAPPAYTVAQGQQAVPQQQVIYQAPMQAPNQIPQQIVYQQQPAQPQQQQKIIYQQVPQQQVVTQGYTPPNPNQQIIIQPQQQQQPIMAPPIASRMPQQALCPRCQQLRVTRTTPVAGLGSWLIAGGCCLVGCWAGCCLIPFCVDDLKDVEHRCSQCGTFVGTKKFI